MQVPVNHIKDSSNIPVGIMPDDLFQRIMTINDFYRLALDFRARLDRLSYNPYKSERIVHGNNKTRRKKQENQTAR